VYFEGSKGMTTIYPPVMKVFSVLAQRGLWGLITYLDEFFAIFHHLALFNDLF
jgi:hypothetical protein